MDIAGLLGLQKRGHIVETRFETDSPIDDIGVLCEEKWRVDFQVKRALSLSEEDDSDFAKVIVQFIKTLLADQTSNDFFCLVTTTDASAKIRYELRKIFESIRSNDSGFKNNPLTKSETETLALFHRLFQKTFLATVGKQPTEAEFLEFSKRAFVSIVDVEAGMPLENATLILLKARGFSHPELVWSLLIKNSLHYAAERMSINRDGLEALLDAFKADAPEAANDAVAKVSCVLEMPKGQTVACGKEVFLIKSFDSTCDLMIVELFRFDDDGTKRVRFKGEKLLLTEGNIECDVIYRCSSMTGLERALKADSEKYKNAKVAILPANEIAEVEDSEPAKLYRAYFDQLVKANEKPQCCLHCGKDVLEDEVLFVEIDEKSLPAAVGLVHSQCRRPLDRVVGAGKTQRENNAKLPEGFDLSGWIKALERGQGLMNGIRAGFVPQGHVPRIAWSSDSEYDPDYRFCVRFALADGSVKYSYERGKVLRLSQAEAGHQVEEFTKRIAEQRAANDPCCFTSKSFAFGPYSLLLQVKKEDEEILEINFAEVAPYTELLSKLYNSCDNYYAPMGIVRDAVSELPVCLCGLVPLISDPRRFQELEANWRSAGFGEDKLGLKLIKDDRDFDNWMRRIFGDGFHPVIDPMFDKNQQLVSGIIVQHQEAMMAAAAAEQAEKKSNPAKPSKP